MTTIRYFAAAAAAAGTSSETREASSLGQLRTLLTEAHGDEFGRVLDRCAVLVDGVASTDPATPLRAGGTVDVLPPFAGG